MSTKLDRLLESIDPSRTLDPVAADVDRAVNSFSVSQGTIDDWDEYENLITDFFGHVQKTVLRLGSGAPYDKDIYWTQCMHMLNQEFGPSGSKVAFEMVRTGKDGGLYRILKTIANKMAETYAEHGISARVNDYWNSLTNDEKLAAADEYLGKYGHLLPAEFTEANAARLKVHFREALKEHPKMIRRMRRIGR